MKTRAVSLANARTEIILPRGNKATSSTTPVSGAVRGQVCNVTTVFNRAFNAGRNKGCLKTGWKPRKKG